jgi:hypothetical protein
LTERTKGHDGQIYCNGALPARGELRVDDAIFDFLLHYQRRDLDSFLIDFRLRTILTLVDFELRKIIVRRVDKDGTTRFAATEHLATLLRYYCFDHDADNGGLVLPPVVRVNGELLWDWVNAPEDEVPQVTLRN